MKGATIARAALEPAAAGGEGIVKRLAACNRNVENLYSSRSRIRRKNLKIVVLGAAGRTGRLVVDQALTRGDQVVAYVRNPHGIAANPGLEIAAGQLSDTLALKAAINGTDAVLVCLGTHGKRMKKNVDLMQKSVPSIIKAMKEANVPRLVLMSA